MERKSGNTIMLTVIAIATLLVAVVGATFAYFSANVDDAGDGQTTVTVNTAAAADTFVSEGSAAISLSVTADKMQEINGSDTYAESATISSEEDNQLKVKLTAGSSKATCKYDLIYTPTAAFTPTSEAATAGLKEFTVEGSSTQGNSVALTELNGSSVITLAKDVEIEDTYQEPVDGQAQTQVVAEDVWSFTAHFYNLKTVDQNIQIGQTFSGVISVDNVRCENAANGQ